MKKSILIITTMLFLCISTIFGQDINQSQVPSVVLNSFQQKFPKAIDVDWEVEGSNYKVDFEMGIRKLSHDVLLDKTGKILKHKEEISKNDLPKSITSKINNDFSGYRIDDVKKISEGKNTIYTIEVKRQQEEWKLTFDPEGNMINKVAD